MPTEPQLVVMYAPPHDGWDVFLGTYWVRRGRAFAHTTERQTQIKLTLNKDHDWHDFFREVENG